MFQTLEEFLAAPFGEPEIKSNEFERKYQDLRKNRKIAITKYTSIEDNILVHITVGSDSNPNQFYDVILMFFTDDEKEKNGLSFRNYYVKFFSNSPSFIYQYAALYKEQGALIDMLYDKLDPEYADKKPDVTNSSYKMSYDKSIYSACRFMQDQKLSAFSKAMMFGKYEKNPDKFFERVHNFQDVKLSNEINQLDKKIDKELEKGSKKDTKKTDTRASTHRTSGKKKAIRSTLSDPKQSPAKRISKSKNVISKSKPKRSTK